MTRRDAWGAGAVVAALMATYIAGSAWSAAIQDTARDVYYAYSIRRGLWFPAEGPILGGPVNGALHLGPAWYYVLSLPLFASDGWLSIALFAAALSSLKFPLAFALGRRALDAPMGIAWACCLALPGWHTFEQLIFFNPNPAAACVLGSVLMALRLRETGSRATAFGFGVLLALTLHVHPTCAPVAALALPALWRAQRRFVLTALLALGFVLPFAPYVAHQLAAGAPDAASTASYMSRQIGPVNLLNSPEVVAASIAGGPQALVAYLWPKSPGIPIIAAGVMAFLVGIAVVAALARRLPGEAMRVFGALWCAVAIFALWIALLRPTTPMYFMYALSPFTAGLAALGVWVALRAMPRPAGVVACLLAILLQAVVAYRLAATVRSGDGVLSARILDVKDRAANKVFHDTWFPAAGRASLGALLCRGDRPKSLHGHLAYVEDRGVGMDALFACGRAEQLRLAGARPDREHWVGMSRAFWKRLDASPACWSGSLGITRAARVAWPAEGIPLANGRRYFPRDPSRGALRPGSATMRASRSQALLVTNPLVGYEALEGVRVTADGNPVNALAANDLSYLFVAPAGPAEVTWSVTFAASAPQAADVVLFERRPAVNVADCASGKEP